MSEITFPVLDESNVVVGLPEIEQDGGSNIDIVIPDLNKIDDTSHLESKEIETTIKQRVVKTALLDTAEDIITPSYLIDFSEVTLIMACALEGLKSLIAEDGDTGIYILNPNGNMIFTGMGRKEDLYRILEPYIESIFGDKVKIYINNGKGFKKIKKLAVDSVVLNI